MSRSGEITMPWGDADRVFRLGIKDWEKVQEKCDAGPPEILARLAPVFNGLGQGVPLDQLVAAGMLGRWRISDVREPLYRGLIGGGLEPTAAGQVIRELVDERPMIESVAIAYRVVLASIMGAEDEPLGEGEAGVETTAASPAASSASPTTTAPARRSASRRATSGTARSGSS